VGAVCDALKAASTDVWHWFFPRKIDPPDCLLDLLRFIYPTVDWSRVSFFDGWPHVLGFSPNAAITLPATYSLSRIHVHFKPGRWNPCTCPGVGLIVHEGFHVLQIQDAVGGWGPGFARPFIAQYLACWAANGFSYDGHPMEEAAYAVAGRNTSLFESCCTPGRLPCDCAADPPSPNPAGLGQFQASCGHVVQQTSGINFWTDMAACTPGLMALRRAARWLFENTCRSSDRDTVTVAAPTGPGSGPTDPGREETVLPPERTEGRGISIPVSWVACFFGLIGAGILYLLFGLYYAVWTVLWSAITVVLWVVKIVVEVIGAIVAGLMWVITGIACAVEWIWERLKDLWRWFKGALGKACTWARDLEQTCTRWEEERTQKCTQTKEERTQKCTQTKEERTRNCCTWWPCSWGCKAWVWVTNVVCVAWTWVTNVVCVAWTWVVTRTCKAFTWVVKGATCW
jgi:hypothetical protein